MRKVQRLLVTGSPASDESLMGYIVRLTELNSYDTPAWIGQMINLCQRTLGKWHSLRLHKTADLSSLAELTRTGVSVLTKLSYLIDSSADSANVLGLTVPRPTLNLFRPKICPRCLEQSNYCRQMWDLLLVTTCPTHQCLLLDYCPNCNKTISWIRSRVSTCSCTLDWRSVTSTSVGSTELVLTQWVHQLFGPSATNKQSSPIFRLHLGDVQKLLLLIARQQHISEAKNNRFSLRVKAACT